MLSRHLTGLSDLGKKKNIISILLISNALVWYSTVLSVMPESFLWWAPAHFSALIVSAFAGTSYVKQMKRSKFLALWMIAGAISSIMIFVLESASPIVVSLAALFLGASLGFGMPACMSYFTDNVIIESRGRVGGITMLVVGIGIVGFSLGFSPLKDAGNLFQVGLIMGAWRLLSLLVFLGDRDCHKVELEENVTSYKHVLSKRSFVLYFAPWIMFSLVDYLAAPTVSNTNLAIIQTVFMGVAAFLGGFYMDYIGRKPLAISGFAMLGIGTAVLSFSISKPYYTTMLYFNAIIDGVAYGFLFVLFVLILWGDLSHRSSSDKYYALGVMPFFVSTFLGRAELLNVENSTGFSFAAFFLFLAVLPLFYAPETLPEKVIKEKQLNIYIEKAQEIAQKYY